MPFGNSEPAADRAISLRKPLRRPEKRPCGGLSVITVGPHFVTPRGFRRLGTLFRLSPVRPAPKVFLAKRPDLLLQVGELEFPKGIEAKGG